jgi:hypothetical protein
MNNLSKQKIVRAFFWPSATLLIITLGTVTYGLSRGVSWAGWQPSPCAPACFCEAFHSGAIIQPLSSYSNLWYILVGLLIVAITQAPLAGSDTQKNLLLRRRTYSFAFGITIVATDLTSLFYHISLTLVGRWLDYAGMYAFVSFIVVYNLARLRCIGGKMFVGLYGALNLGLNAASIMTPGTNVKRYLFIGLIVAVLVMETIVYLVRRPARIRYAYLAVALVLFILAAAVNLLDERGVLCSHESLWQWHFIWHFLTALVTGLLYLYYRSEEDRRVSKGA